MVTQDSSRNRDLKDGDGWQTDNTWLTDGSTGFLYQVPRVIPLIMTCGFPDSSVGKKFTCNAGEPGTAVQFLGGEDPLEKGMATHSSILAWRIPWTVPWGRKESDATE